MGDPMKRREFVAGIASGFAANKTAASSCGCALSAQAALNTK